MFEDRGMGSHNKESGWPLTAEKCKKIDLLEPSDKMYLCVLMLDF